MKDITEERSKDKIINIRNKFLDVLDNYEATNNEAANAALNIMLDSLDGLSSVEVAIETIKSMFETLVKQTIILYEEKNRNRH